MNKPLALSLMLGTALNAIASDTPKVFAHYMTCFSATPDYYTREIELARRYGIDGFALNCGEWKTQLPDGKIQDSAYVQSADRIYQAAKNNGAEFKLFFSPDFAGKAISEHTELNLGDMVNRYYDHPNQFRHAGKSFLSGYSGRLDQYAGPLAKMRAAGREVVLVPAASSGKPYAMTWSFERALNLLPEGGPLDGLFRFTCDGSVSELVDANAIGRRATLYRNKLYMAGVCPAYNSPNLRDFSGMQGYIAMWEGLIRDGADLVEIVTWNDYNEDSILMPYRWRPSGKPQPTDKRYYNRDESYLDVTAYYSNWFKNHVRPAITQDKIYFAYRNRSRDIHQVWDEKEQKWADIRFTKYPYDQLHDDVRDLVYVTAFLTSPAKLEITQGDRVERFPLSAGVVYAETTLRPGFTPQFRLIRDRDVLIDVSGRKEIVSADTATRENSAKGMHLAHRIWMSGAVAGQPKHTFALNDTIMKPGAAPMLIETKSLGATPQNFRLTYRNTGSSETRFTLYANGAPGAEGDFPNYFPLTLPPTGDAFRTISFLWSTWDQTTRFTIRSDSSNDPKLTDNDFNDFGEATLRQLELIPVQIAHSFPLPKPKHPELAAIPGGEFTMGGPGGEPDERPSRHVQVSPFAIGKYEVTNEELERFLPEHRAQRDGFSWRDREPAIYVSWTQSVRYCNNLSRENGLTPAYNEKTWELVENADGFRLPTEAEWEYVASGRGEGRTYPWGNDAPTPDRGNFLHTASLNRSPERTASTGGGVQVVGDYPTGTSRDGVMDLAGNVSEWCTDTYRDYPAGDVTNPVGNLPSPHRAIRGGSWGYYNHSQRVSDREFNNAGYGGYIYIGFRVALNAEGLAKLRR
ncbi:MAG: endo-1,3-alpha-glucanase family glycosylhydrolase [Opitutaceae bacterium]|jgi:formylglycine-generating enzyme required for sulfatase activity